MTDCFELCKVYITKVCYIDMLDETSQALYIDYRLVYHSFSYACTTCIYTMHAVSCCHSTCWTWDMIRSSRSCSIGGNAWKCCTHKQQLMPWFSFGSFAWDRWRILCQCRFLWGQEAEFSPAEAGGFWREEWMTRLHFERGEFFFRCCSSFLTTRKQLPMNWQGDCLRHEGLIADHCDCVDVVDLLGLEVLKIPGFIRCSQVVEKQDCFRVA